MSRGILGGYIVPLSNVMITLDIGPTTVEVPKPEQFLMDGTGEQLRTQELDFDKLCLELSSKPKELAAVLAQYCEQISPLSIILTQAADTLDWCAFEGQVNLKRGTFRVITPIQVFKANRTNPRRPPNQALELVSACALARGLPIWIP